MLAALCGGMFDLLCALFVSPQSFSFRSALRLWMAAVALAVLAGFFVGLFGGLVRYLLARVPPLRSKWVVSPLLGAIVGAGVAAIMRPTVWHYQSLLWWIVAATTLGVALVTLAYLSISSTRWRTALYVALALSFMLLYGVDRWVYVRLYAHLHAALAFVAFVALYALCLSPATALLLLARRSVVTAGVVTVLVLGATVAGAHFVGSLQSTRSRVASELALVSKFLILLQNTLDLDQDGFSALLGGGDCDDFDAAVNPAQGEIPGNGRDDNCNGGDFAGQLTPFRPRLVALKAPPNVLLISVDTLRADAVGALVRGPGPSRTPNIDRLAARSVVFERAYAAFPRTVPSLEALLTGRMRRLLETYPARMLRLTDALRKASMPGHFFLGHKSHRTLSGFLSAISTGPWTHRYPDLGPLLREPGRKLIWVHFFDLHDRRVYGRRDRLTSHQQYNVVVSRVDRFVGSTLSQLVRHGVEKRYLVVLFSDHGEEFYEHGSRYHASSLYEEQVRVPLLIRVPGLLPRRVGSPVSLLDLYPSLAELYRLPISPLVLGRSLVPMLLGQPSERDGLPVPLALNKLTWRYPRGVLTQTGVVTRRYKLIHSTLVNMFELYDLQRDPAERQNLYDQRPDVVARLRHWLARYVDQMQ